MSTFLLWNPEKVSKYLDIPEEKQNAITILKKEELEKKNCSSYIEANDESHAMSIVNSFYNESDINLSFEKIPTNVSLVIFDTRYSNFSEAKKNDGVYEIVKSLPFSTLLSDKKTLTWLMESINMTSECVSGDRLVEAVIVDIESPNDVYLVLNDFCLEL